MLLRKNLAVGLLFGIIFNFGITLHAQADYIFNPASTESANAQNFVETLIYIDNQYSVDEIVEVIDEHDNICQEDVNYHVYDIPISIPEQIEIAKIAEFYEIDPVLLFAIAYSETNFTPEAVGDNGNSLGMYQIQPRWWKTEMNLHDILESTVAACEILSYLYANYHDTIFVLNAYNTGNPNKYNGYSTKVMHCYDEIYSTIMIFTED